MPSQEKSILGMVENVMVILVTLSHPSLAWHSMAGKKSSNSWLLPWDRGKEWILFAVLWHTERLPRTSFLFSLP